MTFCTFAETRENIDNYLERFHLHCEIQELKHEKRQQIILTSITPELYTKLKEQVHPRKLITLEYSELEQLLRKLFHKPSNVITGRYVFHKLVHQVGQPVQEYIDSIKKSNHMQIWIV